ncbi:MAG: hypothetical protein KBC21_01005 [Candidatus Pacebacteria bacterium]|nr:hypothetical protein [Candidatus Paceibacterota bacterium]
MRMPSFNPAPENSTGHENKSRLHRLAAIKGRLIEITRQLNGTMSQIERKPLLDELFELTKEELALEYGDSTTTGMTHFTTEEEKRSANDSQPQNENLVA